MKYSLLALAITLTSGAALADVAKVEQFNIEVAKADYVPYQGAFAERFPGGFTTGLGSGLLFNGKQADGSLSFIAITDRGPNGDSPVLVQTGSDGNVSKTASKMFPAPAFVPAFMDVTLRDGKAVASNKVELSDDQGKITGLPLPANLIGSTSEVALSDTLSVITSDKANGLDSEGIVKDGKGGYWICDEYGPFLVHLDGNGKITQKFGPEAGAGEKAVAGGLPNILKWRQPNRGFEGVAFTPAGKVYGAVQSTLDINGETRKVAQFTRLVELDPATGKTRMFAYPIDVSSYKHPGDAKIGDLAALDDHRFLIIEQGKGKDKKMHNLVYQIDLSQATDLSELKINGKEPEFASAAELQAAGVVMASKTLVADLRANGWQVEKAEGLAIVDDHTFAVASDNDFGLSTEVVNAVEGAKGADDYQTDGKGELMLEGKAVASKVELEPLKGAEAHSALWIFTMDKAL
ncbi:hypothetical protein C4K68_10295 [Pokkaliibacter plantistimulans]|uniref:Phytase-like domain-containing protein n=1 Tax=Proteobacteria bacterium 228 TaxID=2083153 RepID=A0A2S5KRY2_9PROT|nr:esterase-like activity of phytase family protein [Pokkaliibacter plantistimulans]PPC77473.1 hypothetical protein C4K68_10295 [Pokkaliibacter plantistimulans]